jgi:hypothetical protein
LDTVSQIMNDPEAEKAVLKLAVLLVKGLPPPDHV